MITFVFSFPALKRISLCAFLFIAANAFLHGAVSFPFPGRSALVPDPTQNTMAENAIRSQEGRFLENKGQLSDMSGKPVPFVLFKTESRNLDVYITEKGLTYLFKKMTEEKKKDSSTSKKEGMPLPAKQMLSWERVDMQLQGANIQSKNIIKENASAESFRYYLAHCPDGIMDVKKYEKITIKAVYPGIDWVLYNADGKGMKYDFVVHPGADPAQIKLVYTSRSKPALNAAGAIELKSDLAELKEQAPQSFQGTTKIESRFILSEGEPLTDGLYKTTIELKIGNYNTENSLTIDPQLVWGTGFGGNGFDSASSMDVDLFGNLFITGGTTSTDFPMNNGGSTTVYYQTGMMSVGDLIISKFSNAGVLLWSTYYGGTNYESVLDLTTGPNGDVYIVGSTESIDFPLQSMGTFFQGAHMGNYDAVILRFDNNGNRLWATYYGGTFGELGCCLAVDNAGNLIVGGMTTSFDFPLQDAGTFFQSLVNINSDVFILKFDNAGNRLWSTCYGGSGYEQPKAVAFDGNNDFIMTGVTVSPDFPLQNAGTFFQGTAGGLEEGFILKFTNTGVRLFASYYGGAGKEYLSALTVDAANNVYIAGVTSSVNFPLQNAGTFFQSQYGGGASDNFILKLDVNLNRLWATYYGGNAEDGADINPFKIKTDACGNLYLGFTTASFNMPVVSSCDPGYNSSMASGPRTIHFSMFDGTGNLRWATYIGQGKAWSSLITDLDANGGLFIVTMASGTNGTLPIANPGNGAWVQTPALNDIYILKFSKTTSSFSYPGNLCAGGPSPMPVWNGNSSSCGLSGTYSSPSGLSIDPSTGVIDLTGVAPGTYSINYSVASGCSVGTSLSTTIAVVAPPAAVLGFHYASPVCRLSSNIFPQLDPGFSTGGNYMGSPGLVVDAGSGEINVEGSVAGTYSVSYSTLLAGCSYSGTSVATGIILPGPVINLSPNTTIYPNGNVALFATSTSSVYTWTPPAGLSCTTCSNPVASPAESTLYCVTVRDSVCENKACVMVEIVCPGHEGLDTPNAFTPNGDGINDAFCLQGWEYCLRSFSVHIYDQWGELVFESTDASFCWDGTYKGKVLDPAVFVYHIKAVFSNGEVARRGNISLLH